jgi:hypothetical protein
MPWTITLCKPGQTTCPIVEVRDLGRWVDTNFKDFGTHYTHDRYEITEIGKPGRPDEFCASADFIGEVRIDKYGTS